MVICPICVILCAITILYFHLSTNYYAYIAEFMPMIVSVYNYNCRNSCLDFQQLLTMKKILYFASKTFFTAKSMSDFDIKPTLIFGFPCIGTKRSVGMERMLKSEANSGSWSTSIL